MYGQAWDLWNNIRMTMLREKDREKENVKPATSGLEIAKIWFAAEKKHHLSLNNLQEGKILHSSTVFPVLHVGKSS